MSSRLPYDQFIVLKEVLMKMISEARTYYVTNAKNNWSYLKAIDDVCEYINDTYGFTFDRTDYKLRYSPPTE